MQKLIDTALREGPFTTEVQSSDGRTHEQAVKRVTAVTKTDDGHIWVMLEIEPHIEDSQFVWLKLSTRIKNCYFRQLAVEFVVRYVKLLKRRSQLVD